MVEIISADIELADMPRDGYEAYNMVIVSLATEIKEKTEILTEMLNENVMRQFVQQWCPDITNVNIHV